MARIAEPEIERLKGEISLLRLIEESGLKVLFASGYSSEIAGQDLKLKQGENFIQKPFTATQLVDIVRRTLDTAAH